MLYGYAAAILGLAFLAAGCAKEELQPAAEPAESPPTTVAPVGKVRAIGMGAEGMIFHERSGSVAVGLREPYRLAFVDPDGLFIRRQFILSNPIRHLGLSPEGVNVVVPIESANKVREIRPDRPMGPEIPTGEHPHDATSARGKLFVADEFGDTVSVIEDGEVVQTLPAPAQPGGIAASGDSFIAMITVSERVLQVYDAASGEALGQVPAGTGPTHIETFGRYAYVADTEGDMIRMFFIGRKPEEVVAVSAAGVPYGIAVDPTRKLLWVTLTATNQLAGYSIRGPLPRRVATYATVRQPNTVTVDPRNGDVFVASRSNATIQRISPEQELAK